MAKMGRPTLRTPEIVQAILDGLSRGQTLTSLCEQDGMPSPSAFRAWAREDAQLSADFARARDAGFDAIADDTLRIADSPVEGVREKLEMVKGADGQMHLVVTERTREDMLGHRKLQIETRLKLLAKWDPRRYGDKVEVKGTMTLEQLVVGSGTKDKGEGNE